MHLPRIHHKGYWNRSWRGRSHPCNWARAHEFRNLRQASPSLDSSNFAYCHSRILATEINKEESSQTQEQPQIKYKHWCRWKRVHDSLVEQGKRNQNPVKSTQLWGIVLSKAWWRMIGWTSSLPISYLSLSTRWNGVDIEVYL